MIKQAIIPLAGLGTRLLPLTSVFAKELLPINGKPGIQYILDECIEAGIKEVVFIISKKKQMIKNYFYNDSFYKKIINKKKDPRIIKEYKQILKYKKMIKFVYQNKPLGTGDAVLKTKKYIKDKFFLMLLPDDLIIKTTSLIPASIHSSKIYWIPGFPLIGNNSFAKTLVKGKSLVPKPAKGIIACLIIKSYTHSITINDYF